jgi:hypothetical protein
MLSKYKNNVQASALHSAFISAFIFSLWNSPQQKQQLRAFCALLALAIVQGCVA